VSELRDVSSAGQVIKMAGRVCRTMQLKLNAKRRWQY
jgi:hypothetical protein